MEKRITIKIKDGIYILYFKIKLFKIELISISKKFKEFKGGCIAEEIDFEVIENKTFF